jgi:hypothetical protein
VSRSRPLAFLPLTAEAPGAHEAALRSLATADDDERGWVLCDAFTDRVRRWEWR